MLPTTRRHRTAPGHGGPPGRRRVRRIASWSCRPRGHRHPRPPHPRGAQAPLHPRRQRGPCVGLDRRCRGPRARRVVRRASFECRCAMYRAKSLGRDTYQLYSVPDGGARPDVQLEVDLKHAVERSEMTVLYQPVVDMRTSDVVAVEALTRWQHPVRGVLDPELFLVLATDPEVIAGLDTWVVSEACRQMPRGPQAESILSGCRSMSPFAALPSRDSPVDRDSAACMAHRPCDDRARDLRPRVGLKRTVRQDGHSRVNSSQSASTSRWTT